MATATPYTSKQLTESPLPDIQRSEERTQSSSKSRHTFIGIMAKWQTFEKEVRATFDNEAWPTHAITWRHPHDRLQEYFSIFTASTPLVFVLVLMLMIIFVGRERVKCANEIGVVGRFQQQVGHVMTAVGEDLGMRLSFGDWYARQSDSVPDITIWGPDNTPMVVGEAKTPWTLKIGQMMDDEDEYYSRFYRQFTSSAGKR
ncbi:MAG: hypothetical protein Q9196_006209 [Gyalolechia fulgens]